MAAAMGEEVRAAAARHLRSSRDHRCGRPLTFETTYSHPGAPLQIPGKLNLSEFQKVSSALSSMQVTGGSSGSPRSSGAPLAATEDFDQYGYAVPRDTLGGVAKANAGNEYAQPVVPVAAAEKTGKQKPKYREKREQLAMQQGE